MNNVLIYLFLIYLFWSFCLRSTAQTWDNRPVYSMKTSYEQDFTNNTWNETVFYNQWISHTHKAFSSIDIANQYLAFQWISKRILRSKAIFRSPYILEATIGYGTESHYGGIVLRAVGNQSGEGVQEPAETGGGDGFNSEGIALYPSVNGDSLIVQFSGVFVRHNTPVTRIKVPKPPGLTNFKVKNTFRVEDLGDYIYVFVNDQPLVLIILGDKEGSNHTSGSVYNSNMELLGTFYDRLIKDEGNLAICQRVAMLRLYSVKIQVQDVKKQSINTEFIGVKTTNSQPFKFSASASSGLPVSYSLVSGPALLENDSVKLTGKVGVVNILCQQKGNEEYLPESIQVSFFVSKPEKMNNAIPVTGLLICCRGTGDRGPFLINGEWNSVHNYKDIDQVRGILTHVQNAGINIVCIDMSNPSQWTRFWQDYSPMVENIRAVCAEKNMEYFIMIGAVVSNTVRENLNISEDIGHLEWWNDIAKYIWENYATDLHYRTYGFGDNRKIINMFYPGVEVMSLWNSAKDEHKTYLSKFYRGTHEYNQDFADTPTGGWGYRDIQQSSHGKIRFVCPTKGLIPTSSTHILAQEWADRIDWASEAEHYSIYGSYDDNFDNIHWGINDNKNASIDEKEYRYPEPDPYYYYDVLKNKLTSNIDIDFKSPKNREEYVINSSVKVEVEAVGEEPVLKMALYINDSLVSVDDQAPYVWDSSQVQLHQLEEGFYNLKVVATGEGGSVAVAKVTIIVGQPDKAPQVSFVSPLNNDRFMAPKNLTVEVDAIDDGSIAKVELFLNGVYLGEDRLSPYIWGMRTPELTGMQDGEYTLKAIATDNANNMAEKTVHFIISSSLSINDPCLENKYSQVKLFPNPVKDELSIRIPERVAYCVTVEVFDIMGRCILSEYLMLLNEPINVSHLNDGIYMLKITEGSRNYLARFIKAK